jgi:Na+/melibiose symporter-like transporter
VSSNYQTEAAVTTQVLAAGLGEVQLSTEEIEKVTQEFRLNGSLKELFQTKIYRRNLLLLIVIWSFCTFSFYLVPYYLDTLPGNLFLLSSSTAIAEIIASIISLVIANKFETRKSIALFALISCVSTIGIILLTSYYKG